MVWRSLRGIYDDAVRGLAKAFFVYFLDQYQIVISDSEQTAAGRRFWELRITWALETPDYHVYVSDGSQEERPLTRIHTMSDFFDVWSDFCYGHDSDCHSHRLLVISTENLS
ncbi:Uncharacterised protein [Budvicia aquatica]|nr:Uncharacterised protein [Budvicia aquatica]